MKIRLFAAVAVAVSMSACGSTPSPVTTTTPTDSSGSATTLPSSGSTQPPATGTGIANPASVFCVEQGGTVEIVDEADGQVGYCILPDGTRVDEWEYYRAENPDAPEIESELPGDGVD